MMSMLGTDRSVCQNALSHICLSTGGVKNYSSALASPDLAQPSGRPRAKNPELTPPRLGFSLKKRAGVVLIH